MKLKLNDKRRFNYIVLALLALIILLGVVQIMIDKKILPI